MESFSEEINDGKVLMDGPTPQDLTDFMSKFRFSTKDVAEKCMQLLRDRTWNEAIETAAQKAEESPQLAEAIRKLKHKT